MPLPWERVLAKVQPKSEEQEGRLPAFLRKPEGVFLALAGVFGLFFCFATPPHDPADEDRHHGVAFLLSEAHFTVVGDAPGHEATVPRSIVNLHPRGHHYTDEQLRSGRLPADIPRTRRHRPEDLRRLYARELAPHDRVPVRYGAAYSPLVYAAISPALALGRAAGLPVVASLWLARVAGLALWLAGVALAIRRAPVGKWGLAAVALLPMSVFQAGSISGDPVSQVVLFLFFAELLRAARRGTDWAGREALLLVGLAALIGLVKPGYAPITLSAVALLVAERSGRRAAWIAAIVAAAHLTTVGWAARVQAAVQPTLAVGVDAAEQALFIATHPLEFAGILLRTSWMSVPAWIEEMVGNVGHLDVGIPPVATAVALLAVLAASMLDEAPTPRPWTGWALLGGFFAAGIAIMTIAYMGWTAVGIPVIHGVQGRYFMLMLPFALVGLPRLPTRYAPPARAAIPWALATVLAVTAVEMVDRYYEF